MDETTENFWAAWGLPQESPKPAFYRLYYDDQGYLLFYSMENVPGNYIEIDQVTFAAGSPRVQVVNGQLRHIKTDGVSKLIPADQGQLCDPRDVCVVVDTNLPTGIFWQHKLTHENN